MTIFSIAAAALLLSCGAAEAMPEHGFHHVPHHLPPRSAAFFPRHRPADPTAAFVAGLVGSVVGDYLVKGCYRPDDYGDTRCFTMVSQLSGRTVQKCVSVRDWAFRPRSEIYEILYID